MSSNEHPDMSGSGCDDDCYSSDEVIDLQCEAFKAGAQQMREMLARFVEHMQKIGQPWPEPEVIAGSMRANWVPDWGKDPGKPDDVYNSIAAALP